MQANLLKKKRARARIIKGAPAWPWRDLIFSFPCRNQRLHHNDWKSPQYEQTQLKWAQFTQHKKQDECL
jgi:hypothetical protein